MTGVQTCALPISLGKKVKEYLDKGELVPDKLTIEMVWDRLDKEDCKGDFY